MEFLTEGEGWLGDLGSLVPATRPRAKDQPTRFHRAPTGVCGSQSALLLVLPLFNRNRRMTRKLQMEEGLGVGQGTLGEGME